MLNMRKRALAIKLVNKAMRATALERIKNDVRVSKAKFVTEAPHVNKRIIDELYSTEQDIFESIMFK